MYVYSSKVVWTGGRRGELSCGNGFKATFTPPLEFQGEAGSLTPEDSFAASAGMSFLLTFIRFAEKEGLSPVELECSCNAILDRNLPRLAFKRVVLHPKVVVACDEDIPRVERCMELAEKYSSVLNSLRPKVVLEYKIELAKKKKRAEVEQ